MFLGALLDAGVDPALFHRTVAALNLGAELTVSRVNRCGISSTKVNVLINHQADHLSSSSEDRLCANHQADNHRHISEHDHSAPQTHQVSHYGLNYGRHLSGIRELIRRAEIKLAAKETAIRAFELLATVEAGIHDVDIDKIHFHEVGAVDSIVDVVCTAVGCDALCIDEWNCSPLNVGGGTVHCSHGAFPVPAPATLELLKGAPIYSSGSQVELVTPTGAALVRALGCKFGPFPTMSVEKIAYGAGTRNPKGDPNVVRLSIGQTVPGDAHVLQENVAVLEAAIDDLNPQVTGYVMDRVLADGALDVIVTAVQMKKSRPGSLLTVLCQPQDATRFRDFLFQETSTLGIRIREERRAALLRATVTVATPWGEVRLKVARLNGTIVNCSPEYDDCRRIAEARNLPLKKVLQDAVRRYLNSQADQES
jgi:hypothetical protein